MVRYADRPWTQRYDPGVPHTLEPYPDKPLHAFLRESAAQSPDRVALVTPARLPLLGFQQQSVTYGDLDRLSDALAAGLREIGATMTEEWVAGAGERGQAIIEEYRGQ